MLLHQGLINAFLKPDKHDSSMEKHPDKPKETGHNALSLFAFPVQLYQTHMTSYGLFNLCILDANIPPCNGRAAVLQKVLY